MATAEQVIAAAMRYMGRPYLNAGHGPNYFDCVGVIDAAWHDTGAGELGCWVVDCLKDRFPTRISAPAPGDLVFWGSEHVGLYVGNGRVLSATTNSGVSISDMNTGLTLGLPSQFRATGLSSSSSSGIPAAAGPAAPAPKIECCPEAKYHTIAEWLGIDPSTPFTADTLGQAINKWRDKVGRNYGSAQGANYMNASYAPLAKQGNVPSGLVPFCVKDDGSTCQGNVADVLAALPAYIAGAPGKVVDFYGQAIADVPAVFGKAFGDLFGWVPGFFVMAGLLVVGAVLVLEGAKTVLEGVE